MIITALSVKSLRDLYYVEIDIPLSSLPIPNMTEEEIGQELNLIAQRFEAEEILEVITKLGYDDGHEDGYDEGYKEGYIKGQMEEKE